MKGDEGLADRPRDEERDGVTTAGCPELSI
jgi:hypothetical protein